MVISGREVGHSPHKTPHVNLSPSIHEPTLILPHTLMFPCWGELDGAQWGETLGGKRKHRPRVGTPASSTRGTKLFSCGPSASSYQRPHALIRHQSLSVPSPAFGYFSSLYPTRVISIFGLWLYSESTSFAQITHITISFNIQKLWYSHLNQQFDIW